MGSSLRYLGCAVAFGFGVVWMTVGLGAAIVCLLLAALGYGAVYVAERAEANRTLNQAPGTDGLPLPADAVELDLERYDELPDDATSPLAAEADYGWPWPTDDGEEQVEQKHAPVLGERT